MNPLRNVSPRHREETVDNPKVLGNECGVVGVTVGWNPASNSEAGDGFLKGRVQGGKVTGTYRCEGDRCESFSRLTPLLKCTGSNSSFKLQVPLDVMQG